MAGQFRYTHSDPLLFAAQIITIQGLYYVCLCFCVMLADILFSHEMSLAHLFSYQLFDLTRTFTFSLTVAYMSSAFFGAVILWHILGRAKDCLDFSTTVHVLHLIVCWIYNGYFPNTWSWFIMQIISVSVMCVTAEYLCMRTEMKSIPLLTEKDDA